MSRGRPVLALEISTLGERHFTGIANVTRMLARELLADDDVEAKFMMGRSEVPLSIVGKLLALEGGDILWWLVGRLDSAPRFGGDWDRPIIGIYPSTKPHRRLFPTEVLIVHDLTTVVTPQFHTPETVAFWQRQLLPDMLSSDLLIAVSQSTAADIRDYFPHVDHIPCAVVAEAACVRPQPTPPPAGGGAPYILVLGTLEPRKNVEVVFELLAAHPELLDRAAFVFVGRWGWGEQAQDVLGAYGLVDEVAQGRIVLTGFVSDEARDQLLAAASAVLYPSFYEGFGLPVIEGMTYGTPVITTYSSSLPEVGGTLAVYFDPHSTASLRDAVTAALDGPGQDREAAAREQRSAWARALTWQATYRKIRDAALAVSRTT